MSGMLSTINTAVQSILEELRTEITNLRSIYHKGKTGQLYAAMNKMFLSGREEEDDYCWKGFGEDWPEEDWMYGPYTLLVHMLRGTYKGMMWYDFPTILNSDNVTITRHEELECGWMLGVTSPGFVGIDTE
jgi:hypothetical protein